MSREFKILRSRCSAGSAAYILSLSKDAGFHYVRILRQAQDVQCDEFRMYKRQDVQCGRTYSVAPVALTSLSMSKLRGDSGRLEKASKTMSWTLDISLFVCASKRLELAYCIRGTELHVHVGKQARASALVTALPYLVLRNAYTVRKSRPTPRHA